MEVLAVALFVAADTGDGAPPPRRTAVVEDDVVDVVDVVVVDDDEDEVAGVEPFEAVLVLLVLVVVLLVGVVALNPTLPAAVDGGRNTDLALPRGAGPLPENGSAIVPTDGDPVGDVTGYHCCNVTQLTINRSWVKRWERISTGRPAGRSPT
jgi:hypothetical protein